MKIAQIALTILTTAMVLSCNQNKENMKTNKNELTEIFPKGEKGTEEWFTGNAYYIGLVEADSVHTTS